MVSALFFALDFDRRDAPGPSMKTSLPRHLLATAALLCLASPAFALNIVLSNDDGLTSNTKALYEALKAAGHDVIVSVPCTGQSGRGAAIVMYSTPTPSSRTTTRRRSTPKAAATTAPPPPARPR
jgi:hypothetical protein